LPAKDQPFCLPRFSANGVVARPVVRKFGQEVENARGPT
jgi:hypothetical protein